MPIAVAVDHSTRTVRATATGMISVAELLAFVKTERTGDIAGYALLFDARDARTDVIGTDVRELADEVEAISRREKRGPAAIVAGGSNYGLARMYELLVKDLDVQVRAFNDRDQAEAWIASLRR